MHNEEERSRKKPSRRREVEKQDRTNKQRDMEKSNGGKEGWSERGAGKGIEMYRPQGGYKNFDVFWTNLEEREK
jgi:hypothetical protein